MKYRKSKDYKPATREDRIKWINRTMLELSDGDLKELYDISFTDADERMEGMTIKQRRKEFGISRKSMAKLFGYH